MELHAKVINQLEKEMAYLKEDIQVVHNKFTRNILRSEIKRRKERLENIKKTNSSVLVKK